MKIYLLLSLVGGLALTGCATTTTELVNIAAATPDVYNATVRALVRNGYQVSHTDRDAGVIAASASIKQAVTQREDAKQVRITVLVEKTSQGTVLSVTWTPPEWAFGTFEPEHAQFMSGLSAALPGVTIR